MGWMSKVFIFLMGFFVLTYWLRNLLLRTRGGEAQHSSDAQKKASGERAGQLKQTITCCNSCGVFVPQNEIVRGRLGHYCSKEHRDLSEKS
ncbi:MAG: PP0621 family protein [Saezia sp.]